MAEAAQILDISRQIGLESGILFANPVPKSFEGDGKFIDGLITAAVAEAEERNISGADSTPFILSKVAELFRGKTVEINTHLVENNAKVGAQIAKNLALLKNR